jgi:hypothetical protein
VFTAPATGFYQVAGQFVGVDIVGNQHPVTVTENGVTTLYGNTISQYGQRDPFDLMLNLNAGDSIGFNVGTGSQGCSFCFLSTGLWADVSTTSAPITIPDPIGIPETEPPPAPMPEPQMVPVLGIGMAGLALLAYRKRRAQAVLDCAPEI